MPTPGEAQQPDIPQGQLQLMRLAAARNADGSPAVSDQEIRTFRDQGVARMQAARNADGSRAVSDQEIAAYYGGPPGNTQLQAQISRGQQAAGMTEAHGIIPNLAAGFGISDTGLTITAAQGGQTNVTPTAHGSLAENLAAATGQAVGDLPATITGWFAGAAAGAPAGAAAGAAVPVAGETGASEAVGGVVGAAVGGGFGSAALPEAYRQALLDAQHSNDIKTPADFWRIVGVSTINSLKAGVVGAVTAPAAEVTGGLATRMGANALIRTGASVAGATAVGVGTAAAMNGHLPTQSDWISTAALVLIQHGIMGVGSKVGSVFTPSSETLRVAKNVQELYTRLGITPDQVIAAAKRDPHLAQELIQQDQRGQPVTPGFNKQAPRQPPPRERAALSAPGKETPLTPEAEAAADAARARALNHEPTTAIGSDHARIPDGVISASSFRQLEGSTSASVSSKGAIGIHQIEPGTARYFGFGEGMDDAHFYQWLHNDTNNTLVANKIAEHYANLYRGDSNATLVAYNAGPTVAAHYLRAGPGTALEAFKDPKAPGGWGYKTIPAERDESDLPLETQKYLAHARFLFGSKSAPQANFANHTTEVDPAEFPGAHIVTNRRGEQVPLVTLHTRSGASFQVNARFAKNFQGFVNDLEDAGYHISNIGGYADRNVAGGGRPSFHDQGAAIDINPRENPVEHGHVVTDLPKNVQQIAEKHGLGWGGAWTGAKKDSMHFSIASEEGGSVVMSREGPPQGPREPKEGGAPPGGGEPPQPPSTPPAAGEGPSNLPVPTEQPTGMSSEELVDSILGTLGEESRARQWWDPDQILYNWNSILHPAEALDSEALASSASLSRTKDFMLQDAFRQTLASDARALEFVEHGPVDAITLQPREGVPLNEAPKQVIANGGDIRSWWAYRAAGRTISLAERGLKSPIDLQQARELFNDPAMKKIYAGPTAIMSEGLNNGLEYAYQSGLYSRARVDRMKLLNPIVVSFRRMMGDNDPPANIRRGSKNVKDPLYKYEGSTAGSIADYQAADIDNLRMLIRQADMNRAVGSLIGAQKAGAFKGVKLTKVGGNATDAVMAAAQKNAGLLSDAGRTPEEGAEDFAPQLAVQAANSMGENTLPYFEDGKLEFWKTDDPNIARLVRTLTPSEANFLTSTLQAMAKLDRAGVTALPGFTEGVLMFHQLSAFIRDPLHPAPYATFMNGIFDVIGKTDAYHEAAASGAISAMVDVDRDILQGAMYRDWEHQGFFDRVVNVVKNPLGAYQTIARMEQAALNVGYYKMATRPSPLRQVLGQQPRIPAKAGSMSREAYLDWGDRPALAIANGIARATPFWQIHFKDARIWWQSIERRPVSTLSLAAMTLTLPTIMNYAANRIADQGLDPKDRYDQISRYMKDNYLIFPPIAGVRIHLRIPPFIATAFKAVPERILDAMVQQNPHAWDDFWPNMISEWTGGVAGNVPTLVRGPLEVATNTDFNDFKPLVPDRVARGDGYMQYTPATSEISKKISNLLGPRHLNLANYSPIMMDHMIDSYSGQVGSDLLKLSDVAQGKAGAVQLADLPLVHAFLQRNPTTNLQSVEDFYNDAHRIEAAHADFSLAKREGNVDMIAEARGGPWNQYRRLEHTEKALSKLVRFVSGLPDNPTLSAAQKAQYTEQSLDMMIAWAKHGSAVAQTVK